NDDSGQTFGPLQPWQFNPSVTRLGPEMSLGRDLVNDAGLDLAMIKVAIGGSNIARWQPPAGIDYLSLVAAVNDGILEIQARGDTVNLLGMAWLQGESDSISTARADAYASNLDNFMNGFRQQMDLANPGLGFADLNLFLVEPADWKNGSNPGIATTANIAKVDQALIDFADNDPNAWHIPTDDFTQFGDNLIHFSATDQLTLGSRIADAVLATIPEPSALCLLGVGLLLSCQRRCRESRSSA
ncbi:MAG: sialate O-acetylesterase, partial [Lacipirellulaceae bacterium]